MKFAVPRKPAITSVVNALEKVLKRLGKETAEIGDQRKNVIHITVKINKNIRSVGFEGFEGQGLRARLCCRRYDSIFWSYYFTPR